MYKQEQEELFYRLMGYNMAYLMNKQPSEQQRLAYQQGKNDFYKTQEKAVTVRLRTAG